jgi:molecular chaperone DnaK (HSP70)
VQLGIDFGTTRTVVACVDRGNFPVVSFLASDGEAFDWFPSLVSERDGELTFGLDALACAGDPSWTVTRSFKRLLADADATPDQRVRIGSSLHRLGDVLLGFFLAMKKAILETSNLPKRVQREPGMSAVVATPANALGPQRFLTLDAFRRAGFTVTAMLNEPSAAGFEYSHRYRNTLTSRREHVVVYDLGGGTFDASLVRMSGLSHDVLATGGRPDVGGDDFDVVLARLALEKANIDPETVSRRMMARLLDHCREAKERLSPNSKRVMLDLEDVIGQASGPVAIETKELYEESRPLVDATLAAMTPVMNRLELEAGDAPEELSESALQKIAGIYVVGGASAFPAIGRAVRERFGRRVHMSPYPSAAIAVGLAIASDRELGYGLTDRFSRYLGVFREGLNEVITFDPIFTEGSPLPSPGSAPHALSRVYRAMHNVGHYRIVECASVDGDGTPQGRITPAVDVYFPFDRSLRAPNVDLSRVKVQRFGREGPLVREEYRLDEHGLVELVMTDVEAAYSKHYRLNAGDVLLEQA